MITPFLTLVLAGYAAFMLVLIQFRLHRDLGSARLTDERASPRFPEVVCVVSRDRRGDERGGVAESTSRTP